ncbi:MAG: phage integrase N-terminal SAM-like domain-containing protein [Endozoicomonas sp.]
MTEVRNTLGVKRYSYNNEQSYCYWMKHPQNLGPDHVREFLTYLAVRHQIATSTQNQVKSPF